MPATDQAIPALDALLDGTVEAAALDPWCGEKTTVRLSGLTVDVLASTSAATAYVRRLFTPASPLWNPNPATTADPDATMRCLALPHAQVAALAERVRHRATGAPSPVLMHVHAPAAWHQLPAGPTLLTDPDADIAPQIVVRHPDGYTVITCDDTDATMNAARHLREIGYRRAEDDGWVCLHASAATLDGRGILIVGDSGAGKSSLALALSAAQGGAFLSNDRTMVTTEADAAPRAVAMPGPIRLNGGTLQALGFENARQWNLTRPKPATDTDWQTFHGASKLHILPVEWHERTGTPLTPDATVDLIVFPQIVQDTEELQLQPARSGPARELLAAQCMSPGDDVYVQDWLGIRTSTTDRLAGHGAHVLDTLAGRPTLRLRFGTRTPYAAVTAAVRATLDDRTPRT
ncbi:hypothetical protein [Streptomyces sp. CBMA123]|uniref:hypothetical protein n=1 Tax=Streptomyces sp. CBMA123 TaxID=1896313 RepID=UPI0016618AFE|nr:hypothetical protein [Streptomyces sp. CBMA123]MBD0688410.1 hypothetical protein [Streptomyces sp. CBMA123]